MMSFSCSRTAWLAGAGLWLISGAAGAAPTPSSLTVEDAVARALHESPRLAAARRRLDAAGEAETSATRRMLPSVHVSEEFQHYDRPFTLDFNGMPFTARDQNTNTFTASAAQPVLGLLRLGTEHASLSENRAAGEAQLAAAEADLRERIQTEFLRTFEAQAMQRIAETSAAELSEQVTVARARLASGVITNADLLRLQVAIANARQQALQAEGQSRAARAALFAAMGVRPAEGATLTLVEPRALLATARAAAPSPAETLLTGAHERRPEVRQQQHLASATETDARTRAYALLPEVNLEAAYIRVDGQQFAPKNSAFVGVKAEWGIWEWGATEHARRAAVAQAAATRHDAEGVDRQIEAEVAVAIADGDAARGAVKAAEEAIASAEEA
ncbi:MAG TPA: TolC family protein, partial [Polyangia bacterium]|nr:TolC family protein [Polyangia bacterium]